MNSQRSVLFFSPGSFDPINHFYPKALNATIHPMVSFFLNLDKERVVSRYCHLHPLVKPQALKAILSYPCRYFLWAGADLLNVTSASGRRQMVIIENNSCPSGQKSMPLTDDHQEQGSYKHLIERTFYPYIQKNATIEGGLAVLYDKNLMEASGYAAVLADCFMEKVYLVPFFEDDFHAHARFQQGVLEIKDEAGNWKTIRAAFRYVTQRPWTRIPVQTKTLIFNPIIACLAGGRNKMIAAKAYSDFNQEWSSSGLHINTPLTIRDVAKEEILRYIEEFGGQGVVKIPYSNSGQGVFTIVSSRELQDFMKLDFPYDRFVVQSLIGNYHWSSETLTGKLYHVGTIPNAKGRTFVADLRMMVSSTNQGILPLCTYARRAKLPLEDNWTSEASSWDMLGTNLSFKLPSGEWDSDTHRLILMDRRDFNKLGIGIDDLIEAYIQTVLSMVAIDKMAASLISPEGDFNRGKFKMINDDQGLMNEILNF
jgi:hypothetical protein